MVECGITLLKTIEIRDASDFNDAIRQEFDVNDTNSNTNTNGNDTPSVMEFVKSNKPLRPGRGKAKVNKFVSDLI